MSVILPPRQIVHNWLLILLLIFAAGTGWILWLNWPQIMSGSFLWQKIIHREMSGLLRQVANNTERTGWTLLLFSFGYGILHALGPGHGKVVIATWLATHPSRLRSSLRLTLAASVLQGSVAVALVTSILSLFKFSSRQLHLSAFWIEKVSYLLVGLLGAVLCWRALCRLYSALSYPGRFKIHEDNCSCGHHQPSAQQMAVQASLSEKVMIVLSMGMRPCSGAIVMLLFSKVIGVFYWGVAATFAMSLGTSMTLCIVALLVQSFRQLASRFDKGHTPAFWQRAGGAMLALSGGIILIIVAVMMWFSAQPLVRGLRPF